MLEAIRTFFGRVRGQHREKETVVVEGQLWRCTKCGLIFLNRVAGEKHECSERI
jgi:rubrerythrin